MVQPDESGAYATFDIIGDIAIVRIHKLLHNRRKPIAESILHEHRNVKTVLQQIGSVSGDFRLRRFRWVAGEKKTVTMHREFGCAFKVDLKRCYFSPRLSFERMRIARLIRPKQTALNMFAGVGTYSILMSKYGEAETVYSIDLNPSAVKYMQENIRLNRVQSQVIPVLGDAKYIIRKHFRNIADHVIMPLPEKAYQYMDYGVMALKPTSGWIHYYDFEHAAKEEDPIEKIKAKIGQKLRKLGVEFEISFERIVRSTGPNWYQVALDVRIRQKTLLKEAFSGAVGVEF